MGHKTFRKKQQPYTVTLAKQVYDVLSKEAKILSMTPDNLATARLIECYQNEDLWNVEDENGQKIDGTDQQR
ncbi:MAG: hypothetical protein R3Y11_02215 [Pseudomonadota bacterium]